MRNSRHWTPHTRMLQGLLVIIVVLLLTVGGSAATPAAAAVPAGVPPGQTHHGTLTVRDQAASIQGTLDGDLSVQDHATVTVTGHVLGSLRAYGKSTVIIGYSGRVDKGILQSTGVLHVQPGAQVMSIDTYNLSGPAVVRGHVAGSTRVSASGFQLGRQGQIAGNLWVWASASQAVQVDGNVWGSVSISGTDLRLGRTSHIRGSTSVFHGTVIPD